MGLGKTIKRAFRNRHVRRILVGPDPAHRLLRKVGAARVARVVNPISEDLRKGRFGYAANKHLKTRYGKRFGRALGIGRSSVSPAIPVAGAVSAQGVRRNTLSQMTGGV